jgi:hypothetical protein
LHRNPGLLFLWRIKEKVGKKKIRPRRAGVFPDGRNFLPKPEKRTKKAALFWRKLHFLMPLFVSLAPSISTSAKNSIIGSTVTYLHSFFLEHCAQVGFFVRIKDQIAHL